MKNQQDIVARIEKLSDSMFSYHLDCLVPFLDWEHSKSYFKDELVDRVAAGQESPPVAKELNREAVIDCMREYMSFAWGKAEDHRGISASRSTDKMRHWLWLLDDPLFDEIEQDKIPYAQYGAPILAAVSEKYDFQIPQSETIKAMIAGNICPECQDGTSSGCGS